MGYRFLSLSKYTHGAPIFLLGWFTGGFRVYPFHFLFGKTPKALSIGEECLIDTAENTFGQSLGLAQYLEDHPSYIESG